MRAVGVVGQRWSTRLLLLAVVGGIVLGIVGMHGLSQTSAPGASTIASPSASSLQDLSMEAMPAMASGVGGHQGHESPGHGHDCDLIAGCLAALLGGGLLLWALLTHHRPRQFGWLKRPPMLLPKIALSVPRRPPDLISLSILRC